ncbi:MAG: hypothetical protein HOW73_43760 [Polyangiaceae bacterium]|nr:hypothetical protein [Polyangiaceae bacterium]
MWRRLVGHLLAATLLLLTPSFVWAADLPVVVVATAGTAPRPGLVEALQIQLAGRAVIKAGPSLAERDLGARTKRASELVGADRTSLVIWVERVPAQEGAQPSFLLHLVGDREGHVLVVVQRSETDDEAGLDRTLALKVAEVFDAIATAPVAAAMARELSPEKANGARAATPPEAGDEAAPPPHFSFVGEVGGWGATGTGTASAQGGVVFGLGARLRYDAFVGELAATGRVVSELETIDSNGRVDASEGAFGASLRLAGIAGIAALGGLVEVGGRVLDATGETPGGEVGTGSTVVPYIAVGPDATFSLTPFLALRADVGVEVSLRHHRFTVNETPILDLGVIRGFASGGFVFSVP